MFISYRIVIGIVVISQQNTDSDENKQTTNTYNTINQPHKKNVK